MIMLCKNLLRLDVANDGGLQRGEGAEKRRGIMKFETQNVTTNLSSMMLQ